MNYRIVADSSSNVFELPGMDYAHVPLKILNQGKEYVDVPGLDVFGMLESMKASREGSSTSCPNVYEWKEAFGDADGVFAVTITSNLSGSYAAARAAAEDYMEEYPDRRVSVIDTLSVGPEAHLVIEKLAQQMCDGDSAYITVLHGEGADEASIAALEQAFQQAAPNAEINVINGGQPVYAFIVAVE